MAFTIEVGHNVRQWTTFEVVDATEEEKEILRKIGSGGALALARRLDGVGRLKHQSENVEDGPDVWADVSDPDIIDTQEDEDA